MDPATGTVWVVDGARATSTARDQLWLVPVTYDNGSLLVGTARAIAASTTNSYLPSVAVLPSGEVGVLYLSYLNPNFSWNFLQTTNGGATISKFTTLTTFTTPIASNPASNQRILGDYIQVRAVGCTFYGTYPARGAGPLSVNSIDPWFMQAPAATACALPALTSLSPSTVCAGGADFSLGLTGTGFVPGAIARVGGALRNTVVASPMAATASVSAADIAVAGNVSVGLIGPLPAGGLSASLPLSVTPLPGSVGSSLLAGKSGDDVQLTWAAAVDATQYRVRRCTSLGGSPCTPVEVAATPSPSYFDPVLTDGNDYWYLVDAVNDCGSTP